MIGKKGIELSLNFIVILIISIILFGFGVRFISMLFSGAKDLTQMTLEEIDRLIGNLICEGSDRVCIGIDHKTIRKKDLDVFGVKIINILEDQDFTIEIGPSDPLGYMKDGTEIDISNNPNLIVNPASRSATIKKNEEKDFGIGVQVPANAVPGTYILNVEITDQSGTLYVPIQKLYVDVT